MISSNEEVPATVARVGGWYYLQGELGFVAKVEGDAAEILTELGFDSDLDEVVLVEDAVVLAREPVRDEQKKQT